MKNQFAIAALTLGAIVSGTNTVQAQTTTPLTATATTTATITISDVISIDSGSAADNGNVAFSYVTAADYNTPQKKEQASALKVTSSKPFHVNVKAGGENFENPSDQASLIPVGVLTIKTTSGGDMGTGSVNLTNVDQVLVGNIAHGSEKILNLDYEISAEMAKKDILGKTAGTYTQTVIYTVTN